MKRRSPIRSGTQIGSPCSTTQRGSPSLPLVGSVAFSRVKAGAMTGVRVHTWRHTSSWLAESAHSVVTSQSRRRPRVDSSRSAGGSSIGASARISSSSLVSSDQRCSRRSSRGRKMPTTTRPAKGWSNMLRTSSVWTSDPSARLMTAGRRRPTRLDGLGVARRSSKPSLERRHPANRAPDRGPTGPRASRGGQPMSSSAATLA